jgi:hypothetical protein
VIDVVYEYDTQNLDFSFDVIENINPQNLNFIFGEIPSTTTKIFNGQEWVAATPKIFNGTDFVNVKNIRGL